MGKKQGSKKYYYTLNGIKLKKPSGNPQRLLKFLISGILFNKKKYWIKAD
jgi:hypothetical protein